MSNNNSGTDFRSFVRSSAPLQSPSAQKPFEPPVTRVRLRRTNRSALLVAVLLASVCAFSLFLALELSRGDLSDDTLAVFRSAMGPDAGEESGEERLGRLKLIEMSGLIEVFAPSGSPILPLAMDSGFVQDDMTARIYAEAGTEVFSILGGTVKSVSPGAGEGGPVGGVVTVAHDGDIEVTYYGLASVLVERGQPVLQRTVLGTLQNDVLYIRITKAGRPVDPLEFLGVAARLG